MQGLLHEGLALTFLLSQNVPKPVSLSSQETQLYHQGWRFLLWWELTLQRRLALQRFLLGLPLTPLL